MQVQGKFLQLSIANNKRNNIVKLHYLDPFQKLLLLEIIDRGSFGTVYKASYRGSLVAAKVISVSAGNADSITRESNMLK